MPAIWLPDARVREQRELARLRSRLVKHKSALKCRAHSTLINFGKPCPVTDLFEAERRRLLARLRVPEPWRANITASVALIDDLENQTAEINRRLKQGHADHRYILLLRAPGIGWLLAAEIGELERFPSPEKRAGQAPARQTARRQGRPDRQRPPARSAGVDPELAADVQHPQRAALDLPMDRVARDVREPRGVSRGEEDRCRPA